MTESALFHLEGHCYNPNQAQTLKSRAATIIMIAVLQAANCLEFKNVFFRAQKHPTFVISKVDHCSFQQTQEKEK